jgi:hypothetical protein
MTGAAARLHIPVRLEPGIKPLEHRRLHSADLCRSATAPVYAHWPCRLEALVAAPATTTEAALVVLRTPLGCQGDNSHKGAPTFRSERTMVFAGFPGEVLCGYRFELPHGHADHLLALVPKNQMFCAGVRSRNRLTRAFRETVYCYWFDGIEMQVMRLSDLTAARSRGAS